MHLIKNFRYIYAFKYHHKNEKSYNDSGKYSNRGIFKDHGSVYPLYRLDNFV